MKRMKLADRMLPAYTRAEERMNAITHGCGILLGIIVLMLCYDKTNHSGNSIHSLGAIIYGTSMTALYTISTIYHWLKPSIGKKVFQILDHCTIYLLIAGTYTPIVIVCFFPEAAKAGYALLALQWGVSAIAILLNAIDLKRFRVFSYTAYIVLGWSILFFAPTALKLIDLTGLLFLLLGGISYTIGAILFAIGSKKRWFHSVFHIFVLIGSFLQFISIYQYVL